MYITNCICDSTTCIIFCGTCTQIYKFILNGLNKTITEFLYCSDTLYTMVESEEVVAAEGEKEVSHEDKLKNCNPIAHPMAPKKLTKKIYKCIKKASKQKTYLRNGLKDVQKHIRKGEKGLVIFAGDVFPVEIMCHLPVVCEDKEIPYCFVPSRQDIGTAMGVKRGSLMVLIKDHADYKDLYDELKEAMQHLVSPL